MTGRNSSADAAVTSHDRPPKQPDQESLGQVHAVLRLLKDDALRPVHHVVGDFQAALGRQVVHESSRLWAPGHQRGVHLEGGEDFSAFLGLCFLPHAGPDVGVDDVGVLDGSGGIVDQARVPPSGTRLPHAREKRRRTARIRAASRT